MDSFKVIEIKKRVFEDNDRQAALLRTEMRKEQTFLLNLMSSPGSGKTTTVLRTIEALKDEMEIGVLEADIDSAVDAAAVAKTGIKVIQLHTGGMCHLNAVMAKQGLLALGTADLDFVILENVGNLVCPAGFDTGAAKNAMILSVPEGDDKPLKYPAMFALVDLLLINKIDALDYFSFDLAAVQQRAKKLNPQLKIIPISAKTGEGIAEWTDWLRSEVTNWNKK
ncbi:MAG: hydrogenase nickel incorporation protein HypB [Halanaerobiales bacterium]|nr:hydrogenase nickel incorporation protein HypB [Halanaerobiales bacterium]